MVEGIGSRLYFGDSSVFSESELNGSSIPGHPPSPRSVEVAGGSVQREDAGIMVLLSTVWLDLGHGVTVAASEGGVYSRRYIYIIYILLTC